MNLQSLFASASINIGLAFLVLSLFSILKKQPSNASIYYARPLSERNRVSFDPVSFFVRLLPSVSWITRAYRVSEDEILETSGLDALIIIRLFKFGINFFVASSVIGVVVLLPVNYYSPDEPAKISHSMDSFTISNIRRGSNRLWVHFSCLWVVSLYGLYLLYKEYNEILEKRIQQLHNIRRRPDQFTVLVREIPICDEHKTRTCNVDHFFYKHHPYTYQSCQLLYDDKELQILLKQATSTARKIENIRYGYTLRRRSRRSVLVAAHEEDKDVAPFEEKLQKLSQKIRKVQCECMCKQKELPVALVTFKSRWGATLAAQSQQHSNPTLWMTETAPEPRDVVWRNLATPYRYLLPCRMGIIVGASLLTIFFAIPVTAVQGIAKFDKLKKWFPPVMAVQFIPGLRSIVTGYLPSVILNGFIYVVPFLMLCMTKAAGCISNSKAEIKTCNMVFYFLVGNVFFLSLVSGSLLDEIGESFLHPRDFPSHLASCVSAQADFFMTYILTDGLAGFSLELLQPGLLCWDAFKSLTCSRGKKKDPYIFSLPYFRVLPVVSLSILIGMVYVIVAPLLLPFLVGYFFLGYAVYINQIQDVYEIVYETCGQYWPYIHHYIVVAIILMQITTIGIFGLKSKPAAAISTIPLLLLTLFFNEYCKRRFLPTFKHYSIQNAMENDELDMKTGQLEGNCENARNSYSPPCLQPVSFFPRNSSFSEPLISCA